MKYPFLQQFLIVRVHMPRVWNPVPGCRSPLYQQKKRTTRQLIFAIGASMLDGITVLTRSVLGTKGPVGCKYQLIW